MALTIYPTTDYDSFISVADATAVIVGNSLQNGLWSALTEAEQEIYLRIATARIVDTVSFDTTNEDGYLDPTTYVAGNSCLPKSCALMAIHDLAYGISSEINPNVSQIKKEKVGDLEVEYATDYRKVGKNKNPFPASVISCLRSYGSTVSNSSSVKFINLEHS